jgi:hypothetical protein
VAWLAVEPFGGVANGPLGATTSHFVGVVSGLATWTRQTNPNRYYLAGSAAGQAVKRIGNTNMPLNDLSNFHHFSASPTTLRTIYGVEIIRGSPNFLVRFVEVWWNAFSVLGDVPLSKMQEIITNQDLDWVTVLPGPTYGAYGASSWITIPVDEAVNGPLNAICCAWNRVTPACHISDFLWSRVV